LNISHIAAIFMRHLIQMHNDLSRVLIAFFYPLIDIVIWGFLSTWMGSSCNPQLQVILLCSIILWQIGNRLGVEIGLTMLEELWSPNIGNLFSTSLTIGEWLIGSTLFACSVITFIVLYCILLTYFIYHISFLFLLKIFVIFAPALYCAGIWVGLMILSIIIYIGRPAGSITFAFGLIFAPFCSVFYPRAVLPLWAQKVGSALPATYVFEGLRNYIMHGINPITDILISLGLSAIYIAITFMVFMYLFKESKKIGLATLPYR
jgi:ABC-2 type transport system permease protein